MGNPENTTAVILAAGLGTRMKSDLPKVLHPVLGLPIGVHVVRATQRAGVEKVVAVVGHQADKVEEALLAHCGDGHLAFALQAEQLGTGHAVQMAQEAVGDAQLVLVLNGDVPGIRTETLNALFDAYAQTDGVLVIATARLEDPTGYGRILREDGKVVRVVEQKDATEAQLALDEINVGMYLADGAYLFETLANVGTDNAQGEVYLTDIIAAANERGDVGTVEIPEGPEMWGINDRAELARVEGAIRLRNNQEIMRSGVSMTMPETITVEPDVEIGSDVVIGRGVRLSGKTVIGDGARIDEGAIITDSQIQAGAHIKPYCVITESHVGTESQVGPFAHLRPGTHLSAKCKVGNFVETKKARLGEGSKASHLSYLGDCDLGEAVNIGAGTITCNYDGVNKFKTTMGNGVFIGSDTQLVAPVTLGDDVYVGAGTTVTEDAPSGSLVISRVPQRNIEGWVEKKKKEREKE